jgi:hypothetical protein
MWKDYFKPLSDFLHGRLFGTRQFHTDFFCDPLQAMDMIRRRDDESVNLDIQTFNTFFTRGPGYWFHFKYITMAKIEKDCKLYFECNRPDLVKNVWAQWYSYLSMAILRLGGQRALASQFQLPTHLSLILRAKKRCIQ